MGNKLPTLQAKKNEGSLRFPRRRSVGTPLLVDCSPPRPFQLRPVPICSALRFLVAGLLPAFIYRRFRVYLKESRVPIESPLWYDRFLWQNPVRVTRPVPSGRCPFPSTLSTLRRVGLPVDSHSVRFRSFDLLRSFHRFQPYGLLRFLNCFQSFAFLQPFSRFQFPDLLRSRDRFQTFDLLQSCDCFQASDLLQSFSRFRSFDLLRPLTVPFLLRSQPFGWWASV